MPASIRPVTRRSWTSAGARPDADPCPASAGHLTVRSMRDEHYRGEVQGRRRRHPARSVHDRRPGTGGEPGRPRPDLQAAARRAGDGHRRGDRLGRAAQPDPGLVRLRGRHRAAEPGHPPQEGALAAQGAARHVPADEPGEHLPLAQPQDGGQAGDLGGRPGRGPAGHRPAGPDLGEVHRQRAALRAARPLDGRAPGAVRARGGQGGHVRAAVAMMPRVVVTGGSVGGLTAALVLRDAGCDVTVFERSSAALQARGAGIAALEATLRYLTERGGRRVADVCSSTGWIRFLRADGSVRHEQRHRYLFSSWNTIYRSLLELFDPGRYLLGHEVTGFAQAAGSVRVTLAGGRTADAGLLVCADGVSSLARAWLLPEVSASYSGYVAWRGT